MSWKSFLGGARKVINVTNQVASNPMAGMAISLIPFANTAFKIVNAADQLFPQQDANETKKAQAVTALQQFHPELDADDVSKIIEAMVTIKKINAKSQAVLQ